MSKTNIPVEPDMLLPIEDVIAGQSYIRERYSKGKGWDIESLRYWRNYLMSIAVSRFEWEGLPAGIDARAVEFILVRYGQLALFMDDGGYLAAQFSNASNINMYYNPNRVLLTSPSGGMWQRHAQAWVEDGEVMLPDCALCYESLSRTPLHALIEYYAQRLAKVDRIVDVNMRAQRTPYVIRSSEQLHGTSKAIMRKLEENDQYIEFNAAGYDPENIGVLNTLAPYVAHDLLTDQDRLVNRALVAMGVDCDPLADKRERKVSLEVLQNNQQVSLARRNALAARQMFCDKARAVFGVEIDVRWAVRHPQEGDMSEGLDTGGTMKDGYYKREGDYIAIS